MSRVPITDPLTATGETARFFEASKQFRGRVPNSARVWGHIPHIAKFQLLAGVGLQRESGGGMLSCRIKEMAVLKTSHVNGCAY
jgi:alkylhydroperoxidase family enzyme